MAERAESKRVRPPAPGHERPNPQREPDAVAVADLATLESAAAPPPAPNAPPADPPPNVIVRLDTPARQRLMRQIGHTQGNRHAQQLAQRLQRSPAAPIQRKLSLDEAVKQADQDVSDAEAASEPGEPLDAKPVDLPEAGGGGAGPAAATEPAAPTGSPQAGGAAAPEAAADTAAAAGVEQAAAAGEVQAPGQGSAPQAAGSAAPGAATGAPNVAQSGAAAASAPAAGAPQAGAAQPQQGAASTAAAGPASPTAPAGATAAQPQNGTAPAAVPSQAGQQGAAASVPGAPQAGAAQVQNGTPPAGAAPDPASQAGPSAAGQAAEHHAEQATAPATEAEHTSDADQAETAQAEGTAGAEAAESEQTESEQAEHEVGTEEAETKQGQGRADTEDAEGEAEEDEHKPRPLARTIQRRTGPADPQADPAFVGAVAQVKGAGAKEKAHEPAQAKTDQAAAAAVMPAEEKLGLAQNAQANVVAGEAAAQAAQAQGGQAPGFDKAAFVASVKAQIDQLTPKDPSQMENIEGSGVFDGAKQAVDEKVKGGKQAAQGNVDDKIKEQPQPGAVPDKPATVLPANDPGAPAAVDARGAAPKPKGPGEVEAPLQTESAKLDAQLAEGGVTEEQLKKSNEPQFQGAIDQKKQVQEKVAGDLPAYRQGEQAAIATAQTDAQGQAQAGVGGMHDARARAFGQVGGQQGQQKTGDEAKRAEIGRQIEGIYTATKTDVEGILTSLDGQVDQAFNAGAAAAKTAAIDYIKRETKAYKDRRYQRDAAWYDVGAHVEGALTHVGDALTDMPPEYYEYYKQGRDLYTQEMEKVINRVADIVADHLARAKARIEQGRKEIADFVAKQPAALRDVAQQAASQIDGRFGELEQSVDSKAEEIASSLAQRYVEHAQALDDELNKMKEDDKGLLKKAADAIGSVIDTIRQLGEMLANTLSRAASAVTKILEDPIGFLGNLIAGIGQGMRQFGANILTHLQTGLIEWLTGAVGSAGITLPASLDLKGIFELILQLLGLTWGSIRARIVKALGPQGEAIMGGLEKAWEVIQVIQSEGLGGLWRYVQQMIGDLKAMVMDQIKSMIANEVIRAGIEWVVGMLGGPAGAFIKAVQGIIRIVTWIINNGSRVAALVNSVIDSVVQIAAGNIGGAANFIEQSLAKAIPVVISFLADLLGLGGIARKVQGIIQKVQEPVGKAIDWIVGKAKAMAKKVMGFMRGLGKKETPPSPEKQREVDAGLAAIDQAEQAKLEGGEITREKAEQVAVQVKGSHPVFKSLKVVDGGERWNYDYQISRAVKVGEKKHDIGGLQLTGDQILQLIRRVAASLYNDPQTTKGAADIRESERERAELSGPGRKRLEQGGEDFKPGEGDTRKSPTLMLSVPEETPFPARARYVRERDLGGGEDARPFGAREEVTRGHHSSPSTVGARAGHGGAPYVEGAGAYPALAARLQATGVPPQRMAFAIRTFIRTGTVPIAMQAHASLITEAAELMAGTEAVRNPASLVTGAMVTELAANPARDPRAGDKQLTWKDQFGRFPMAPVGAVKTADTVNKELGFEDMAIKPDRKTLAKEDVVEKAKQQEISLAVDFVQSKVGAQKFESEAELEAFVESEIRKFYGMRQRSTA